MRPRWRPRSPWSLSWRWGHTRRCGGSQCGRGRPGCPARAAWGRGAGQKWRRRGRPVPRGRGRASWDVEGGGGSGEGGRAWTSEERESEAPRAVSIAPFASQVGFFCSFFWYRGLHFPARGFPRAAGSPGGWFAAGDLRGRARRPAARREPREGRVLSGGGVSLDAPRVGPRQCAPPACAPPWAGHAPTARPSHPSCCLAKPNKCRPGGLDGDCKRASGVTRREVRLALSPCVCARCSDPSPAR